MAKRKRSKGMKIFVTVGLLLIVLCGAVTLILYLYPQDSRRAFSVLATADTPPPRIDPTRTFTIPGLADSATVSPNGMVVELRDSPREGPPQNNPLRVWDLSTGKQIATFGDTQGDLYGISRVTFSQDGKYMISGWHHSGGPVRVWDTATWSVLHRFAGPAHAVYSVAVSPNGRLLATLYDARSSTRGGRCTILVWDLRTGQLKTTLSFTEMATPNLVFSRDGKRLACCFAGCIEVWDVPTSRKHVVRSTKGFNFQTPKFTPDARSLMVVEQSHLYTLDIATGQETKRLFLGPDLYTTRHIPGSQCLVVRKQSDSDSFIVIYDYGLERELVSFAHLRGSASAGNNSRQRGVFRGVPLISENGDFFHYTRNNTVSIWDMAAASDATIPIKRLQHQLKNMENKYRSRASN